MHLFMADISMNCTTVGGNEDCHLVKRYYNFFSSSNKMECFHGTYEGFAMFHIFLASIVRVAECWKLCGKVMFAHLR